MKVFDNLHLQTMHPTGRAYETDFNEVLIDIILFNYTITQFTITVSEIPSYLWFSLSV